MTNTNQPAEGAPFVYQCRLDLSTSALAYLRDLLRSRLKAIRSPFRSQPPGRIAVLVLAMLRHDQRLLDLAGGNDVPESTLRRWRDEMIDLLAAKAPRLDRALRKIATRGAEVVLIDGTLIPTQRRTGKAHRPNYSGKHHRHFSALSKFRARLVGHGLERTLFDRLVEHCREAGLIKAGGKQRTDSTHVISAVRDLNRTELAGESVRAALEALAVAAPSWLG